MGDFNPYTEVVHELIGTAFGTVTYVDETGSTNEDAAALLSDPASAGLSIVAERQRAGSGRKGRSWLAQPGTSLLLTTIFPGSIPTKDLWAVPFGVAIAVRRALYLNGIRASLHWPNDLLIGENKVAGILCTTRIVGERAWVGAGVGINVHRTAGAADGIVPIPAFCDDVVRVSRAKLLRDLLLIYDSWGDIISMPQRVARMWERQAGLPGKTYRILKDGSNEPFEAVALGLSNNGGLNVQHHDGRRETIDFADARALR